MTQVVFHYSTPHGVVLNRYMGEVEDLRELREYAAGCIRSLISGPNLEDWRNWILHVSDETDEQLFEVPFRSFLGKLH
jgi:uncharacterized protein DUF6894